MVKKKTVQPEVNIGLVGHVDHGKTTLTQKLSGKWTDTHSEEIKRGITIRLGYADTTFVKIKSDDKKINGSFSTEVEAKRQKQDFSVLRKVSFVDAPGHESLMATMLAGATIMDGAILMVAANESCPQPQTREHLMALEIVGIKNLVVVQNKIDLVRKEDALKNYNAIKEFLKGSSFEDAPIIPISAQHNINIDLLIESIEKIIPTPKRDASADPTLLIARSFDINKPGTPVKKLTGGVLGGSLIKGELKEGVELEIRPGFEKEEQNKKVWYPLKTTITKLMTGGEEVKSIHPGGSVAVGTLLDPTIVKSDTLTGCVAGIPGKLPPVHYDLKLDVHLLERVVGSQDDLVVDPLKLREPLMLNVNSAATVGFVSELKKKTASVSLRLPVCADIGSRVTISRRVGNRFRLIGFGIIQ